MSRTSIFTVTLDDALIAQVKALVGVRTTQALVELALEEFVIRRVSKLPNLRDLKGRGGVRADYDHKALRT